ncbi:MAG: DUF2177 family protein [Hyphomicrobiales bacterium]
MMRTFAAAYLGCAATFLALEAVWIGWIAKRFYLAALASMMRPRPDIGAALGFYVIYLVGMVVFAVLPSLDHGFERAALLGALYGFCAYATYDLTNLATLRDFPARPAVVDLI